MFIYDLIGIGFGPSNIALAIALEEKKQAGHAIEALFIEKQASFTWHKNMLLDQTHMQISFLKDLVTLRNPSSPYTFLNYLHEKQRLQDFINLKTFYPSRHEFNDYLSWAAAQFKQSCAYGEEVLEVLPEERNGEIGLLRVRTRDQHGVLQERLTRNLVVSVGGIPRIPEAFLPYKQEARIFHSNSYIEKIAGLPDARRIAIIGAGQSAAEIFLDLHGRSNKPQLDLIMRARSIKPSDSSPFVNEIFNPEFTDYVFNRPGQERSALLEEFAHTNYAAPDLDLIEQIFDVFYQQRVTNQIRHRFLRRNEMEAVRATDEGIQIVVRDLNNGLVNSSTYDAVILATGYERDSHKALLDPLAAYLGDFAVDRNYRLQTTPDFHPAIFLQGACEMTHGLSDTLLSVTAIRSEEIGLALLNARKAQKPSQILPGASHRLSATAI